MYANLKILCLIVLTGCNSSLTVSDDLKSRFIAVDSLDRLSAKPGEIVTVTGTNLTDDIEVLVNGRPAKFTRIDDKSGSIEMPADMEAGVVHVSFSRQSKSISSIPLLNGNSVEALSPTSIPLDGICDSFIIKTENNELARGKVNCARQQTVCSHATQADCKTTGDFPAVVKAKLAEKLIEGQTVAGVSGTATPACP